MMKRQTHSGGRTLFFDSVKAPSKLTELRTRACAIKEAGAEILICRIDCAGFADAGKTVRSIRARWIIFDFALQDNLGCEKRERSEFGSAACMKEISMPQRDLDF